jgi:hypothetical protein
MHCSNLAVDALRAALHDYFSKHPELLPAGVRLEDLAPPPEDSSAEEA